VARQLPGRSESGFTRVVISALAVIPILAVLSVPSFQNVTEAYKHREALRQVRNCRRPIARRNSVRKRRIRRRPPTTTS
jgi:Tfp pilus assembly major pilin PilA